VIECTNDCHRRPTESCKAVQQRTFTHGHRQPTLWLMGEALYNSQRSVPLGWTLCMLMGNNILMLCLLLQIDNWVLMECLLLLAYFKIPISHDARRKRPYYICHVIGLQEADWIRWCCVIVGILLSWSQCRVYL
jgi:hypothetical protein